MTTAVGTEVNPLRVAIIGSGPSGFYAAEALQKRADLTVQIDMFERLPTPYGLVRGGVAPDHQKIKSVTKVYDRIAARSGFRFLGNVTFGEDITHDEIVNFYHAVIYAVGAQSDRKLDIPGEDLPGSHPATEFVAWYNAHPDFRDLEFDLSQEKVAVIGNGNVAVDVVRILARTVDELRETDIADYALEALSQSKVKEIYMLGRRGPLQAAFTNPEIKELGETDGADIIAPQDEVELDDLSREELRQNPDRTAEKNWQILTRYAHQKPSGKPRRIITRFLVSPTEILGTDRVEGIKIVKNELYRNERGVLRPRPTDRFETIPVGLVFRSIGYRGVPLPGVPFRDDWGIIPNADGRVIDLDTKLAVTGEYVVGWIKRGPSGVIGTNKPDSVATVDALLEDVGEGKLLQPSAPSSRAVNDLLREKGVQVVDYDGWEAINAAELARGQEANRPRLKFSRVDEMLRAANGVPDPAGD